MNATMTRRPNARRLILANGTPNMITFAADVAIQADGSAPSGTKRPTFTANAYNGGLLKLSGWAMPVVIDLSSLKAAARVPMLLSHDPNQIAGQTDSVKISASGIDIAGFFTGTADPENAANEILAHAADGFAWQVSVGVEPGSIEQVRAGSSVTVNGQSFAGPVTIARNGQLREVSFVAIGADRDAAARIAATGANGDPEEGGEGAEGADRVPIQAAGSGVSAIRAEHARIAAINELCDGHPKIAARAIADGWTTDRTEVAMMRASKNINPINRGGALGRSGQASTVILQAALFKMLGQESMGEKLLGAPAMQAAADLRPRHAMDLFTAALMTEGREIPHGHEAVIRAAFSTTSLPVALTQGIDKLIVGQLANLKPTWRGIAKTVPVPNFRPQSLVRLVMRGGLSEVGNGGQIKHAKLEEAVNTVSVATFAKMITLTRQNIINDDLSLFSELPALFAVEWMRTISDLVWKCVLANAGSFFAAGHANYLTGAGAASTLGPNALAAAVQMLRAMVDEDGRILDIPPTTLVVPPELEMTGRALLNSALLGKTDGTPTGNPFEGLAGIEVEPRLSSSSYTNSSALAWYLFGPASVGAVTLGFLNGNQNPTVESAQSDFDTLGMQWRVYGDAGAALAEPRGAVKSRGAA